MRIAHFEAQSGIAGDMTVAALLDAGRSRGLAVEALAEALGALPLGHYHVAAERVEVGGIPALHFRVDIEHEAHAHHRHWSDIRAMLAAARAAGLADGAFDRAMAIFEVLARAEAEVHGVDIDRVHFHEVGAVDSIVDIVGTAWCLDRLGIDACTVSPVATGSGNVRTEHGLLPVPAPATALLLRGFEVRLGDGDGELATPTGAAILAAMARPLRPAMRLDLLGAGAGTRRLADRPNVLRVFVGDADEDSDEEMVLVEADLDDMTPAALAFAAERLRAAGARDVSVQPLQMKKGRLGMRLGVLASPSTFEALSALVLAHTSTIGVRYRPVRRRVLERRIDVVEAGGRAFRVKAVVRPDGSETVEPEFEDVASAARERDLPFAEVHAMVLAAAQRRT